MLLYTKVMWIYYNIYKNIFQREEDHLQDTVVDGRKTLI
jgi:hypothetical protein